MKPALLAAATLALAAALPSAVVAQPGGITGPGQVAPDSRTVRAMDEHTNHPPKNHRKRVCTYHRDGHGHRARRCNWQ